MEKEPQCHQCVIPLHKPSRKELIFFFASGILVSIPFATFFEGLYPAGFSAALLIVVVAPFVEELAKVFPLFYRHGETERSIVTLGVLLGLGFGIAEFFEYVVFLRVSPLARLPGIIFHASSAAIIAYGIAKKKPLPYYLTAVALHVANNFFALSSDIFLGFFAELLILITVYLLAWRYWHQASKDKMVV
jgi:RsiW-degrading membrane proteinase PrsW (M82 family)